MLGLYTWRRLAGLPLALLNSTFYPTKGCQSSIFLTFAISKACSVSSDLWQPFSPYSLSSLAFLDASRIIWEAWQTEFSLDVTTTPSGLPTTCHIFK
jgi:hypothetical protein